MNIDGGQKLFMEQQHFSSMVDHSSQSDIRSAIHLLKNIKLLFCEVESYNVEGCNIIVKCHDGPHAWNCAVNFDDLPLSTTPQSYHGFTYLNFVAIDIYLPGAFKPRRVQVSTMIRPGMIFPAYFTARPRYCLLRPVLQWINVENMEFCIEHRQDPVRCFAGDHARPFLKFSDEKEFQPFVSVDDFKIRALSNLILEVSESHTDQFSTLVKLVGVSVHLLVNDDANKLRGKAGSFLVKFNLLCTLCRSRRINFCRSSVQLGAVKNDLVRDLIQMDHFCITAKIGNRLSTLHCSAVDVQKISAEVKEESQFLITARVTYTSAILQLRTLPSTIEDCTIEYLPIPLPLRLMMQAVAKVDEISWCNQDLMKLILGTYSPSNEESTTLDWINCPVTPNNEQKAAVERTLTKKIWFIWGPPD